MCSAIFSHSARSSGVAAKALGTHAAMRANAAKPTIWFLLGASLIFHSSCAPNISFLICAMEHYRSNTCSCPSRKSYPDVLVVQSSQDRNGDNGTRSLDCSMQGRIFLQCQVRARLIVIRRISGKNSPQVHLAEH